MFITSVAMATIVHFQGKILAVVGNTTLFSWRRKNFEQTVYGQVVAPCSEGQVEAAAAYIF